MKCLLKFWRWLVWPFEHCSTRTSLGALVLASQLVALTVTVAWVQFVFSSVVLLKFPEWWTQVLDLAICASLLILWLLTTLVSGRIFCRLAGRSRPLWEGLLKCFLYHGDE